jgi:hypothetical protein
MKDFLIQIVLLVILYWYFNIRGKTKCVTIVPEFNNVDYIEQI